jgi:hypothetical protein
MKHFLKYGTDSNFKNFTGYLAAFLKANIRTTFTYPKTIWYSLRYNAGEKFILHSNILYPFKYDMELTNSQEKEPVRLSTSLLTNVVEFQIQPFKKNNFNKQKSLDSLAEKFQATLDELYKLFHYNRDSENFDVPAAVSARVLYAIANINIINQELGKNQLLEFSKETLEFILYCFLKKLEFADSESISQVLYAMSKLNLYENTENWNNIIQTLVGKSFDVEFTRITPYFPHLFRYHEVDDFTTINMFINELGNKLFISGYKSVFEAYYAISNATQKNNKIHASDVLKSFEERFGGLKNEYSEYVKQL